MKLDILAFGAHPDDVELGCSGTIAKEVTLGKKVGIVDLTRGELGTRGTAEIRDREANDAAKVLGVSVRENLNFRDGFFVNDEAHQMEVIRVLRKYRPNIVLCNAVKDRHIDHGKGASLVADACFLSGLRRIETTEDGVQQEAWRPKHVFHYIQWQPLTPDFYVDISGFMDVKVNSIYAYKSQFYDPKSKEPETPISSKNFIESVVYRSKDYGRVAGADYAEGFITNQAILISSLDQFK